MEDKPIGCLALVFVFFAIWILYATAVITAIFVGIYLALTNFI